ncbi:hypothetical protein B0H34DRAFT_728183 [Crassisporium funariophilum]|nr:hypothetical protein B0H34DRAFT_728183 [Crassisporium funariophilum]
MCRKRGQYHVHSDVSGDRRFVLAHESSSLHRARQARHNNSLRIQRRLFAFRFISLSIPFDLRKGDYYQVRLILLQDGFFINPCLSIYAHTTDSTTQSIPVGPAIVLPANPVRMVAVCAAVCPVADILFSTLKVSSALSTTVDPKLKISPPVVVDKERPMMKLNSPTRLVALGSTATAGLNT